MPLTILLTGFGPFPGAPINPTGPLVQALARLRRPALANIRLVTHVFPTSYQAVDADLPLLLSQLKPDGVVMFGLATKARCLRVETRARNAISRLTRDATGHFFSAGCIVPGGPQALSFALPASRFVLAARRAGIQTAISRDAGRYLCNYLSWRAIESTTQPAGPKFAVFVHIPPPGPKSQRMSFLLRGAEVILLTAIAETRRRMTKR